MGGKVTLAKEGGLKNADKAVWEYDGTGRPWTGEIEMGRAKKQSPAFSLSEQEEEEEAPVGSVYLQTAWKGTLVSQSKVTMW